MTKTTILMLFSVAVASAAPAFAVGVPSPSNLGIVKPLLVATAVPAMSRADLSQLVGRKVANLQGKKVGNIDAIYVNADGSVKRVIIGVGGFLGLGDHDVALGWDNLHFSADGKIITLKISKAELKAMPKFEYADIKNRGTVYGDAQ